MSKKTYDLIDYIYKLQSGIIKDRYYPSRELKYPEVQFIYKIVKSNKYMFITSSYLLYNIKISNLKGRSVSLYIGSIRLFDVSGKDIIDMKDIAFPLLPECRLIYCIVDTTLDCSVFTVSYNLSWLDSDNLKFLSKNNFVLQILGKKYMYKDSILGHPDDSIEVTPIEFFSKDSISLSYVLKLSFESCIPNKSVTLNLEDKEAKKLLYYRYNNFINEPTLTELLDHISSAK